MVKKHIIAGGLILLAGFVASACQRAESQAAAAPDRAQPVEVTPVSQRTLADTLLVVGSIAPNESTEIRTEVSGIVRGIHFREGEEVAEDQLLVQLDDQELRAQLREAEVRLQLARQTLERHENLLQTRSVPESERDRSLAEFERTRAEVDLLNVRLEKTRLRAPFAGRIGDRRISPGDLISPSDAITRLTDLSRLKVDFELPERHAGEIHPGTIIHLMTRAGASRRIVGEVYFVSPVIERATRSIAVKAYVEDPPATLLPGMFVQVEVVLQTRENVLTVPETAILAHDGQHFLVLVNVNGEGREAADFRPVQLGLRQQGMVEISPRDERPLLPGQRVVSAGVGALPLFPGAIVEARPARAIAQGIAP